MKLQYEKIGQLIYLVFKSISFATDEAVDKESDFIIMRDKRVFVKENSSFGFEILCFSPKEKGYRAMADNFAEFQKAIEKRFLIKAKCETGYEYFKANVFISDTLNLECDNEKQLYVMRTKLTFNEIDYNFKERE